MSVPSPIRDTSPEANAVLIQLVRDKPNHLRLKDAVMASNRVAEQCKDAIRRSDPELSEDEVKLRFIALNYGKRQSTSPRIRTSSNCFEDSHASITSARQIWF